MRSAIAVLLETGKPGKLGGFVIFSGKRECDYVQYALLSDGLLLWCPTIQEGGKEHLPAFEEHLRTRGFTKILPVKDGSVSPEQIQRMKEGQYAITSDGLYAQVGKDVEAIRSLTLLLMKDIFLVSKEADIEVTLNPQGE